MQEIACSSGDHSQSCNHRGLLNFFETAKEKKKCFLASVPLYILECSSPTPCPWFNFLLSSVHSWNVSSSEPSGIVLSNQGSLPPPIIIVHPWVTFTSFIMLIIYYYKCISLLLIYFQSPTSHQKLNEMREEPSLFLYHTVYSVPSKHLLYNRYVTNTSWKN